MSDINRSNAILRAAITQSLDAINGMRTALVELQRSLPNNPENAPVAAATTSPVGGPMGIGQSAAADPAGVIADPALLAGSTVVVLDDGGEIDPPNLAPIVRNPPKRIWLCVGDIEYDDEFANLRDGEISWCDDRQGDSDILYVLVDRAK